MQVDSTTSKNSGNNNNDMEQSDWNATGAIKADSLFDNVDDNSNKTTDIKARQDKYDLFNKYKNSNNLLNESENIIFKSN